MKGEIIKVITEKTQQPVRGSAGLCCHVPNGITSVSSVANASGGIGRGHLIDLSAESKINTIKTH